MTDSMKIRSPPSLLLALAATAPSSGGWLCGGGSPAASAFTPSSSVPRFIAPIPSVSTSKAFQSSSGVVRPRSSARTSALRMASSGGGPLALLAGGRPLLSEDDMAAPPDDRVVEAVERGGSANVIASDIATKAGVSLSLARKSLSTLATLSGGDIAVTADGELVYSFPKNVRNVVASNSARYKALQTWQKDVQPKLFYGLRVGFGVVLFVSIFAIFSTLFFVSTAGGASDRDDRDRRRGGGGFGMGNLMFDLFFPRNYFFYQPYYGYYGRMPYAARLYGGNQMQPEEPDPNIFERVFSYIFGDGDPNNGIETARLRAAAQVIRENGGAVVAEQLAPFADEPPAPDSGYMDDSKSGAYVDESYVLPIVSQLGGEPTVTEDGDIVYVFPELQLSAESTLEAAGLETDARAGDIAEALRYRGVDVRGALEKKDLIKLLDQSLSMSGRDPSEPIQEEEVEFNRSETGWNVLAGVLGAVNLGGALYLGQVLSSPALYGVQLPSYFGLVQAGYPLLLAYGLAFNIIPAIRSFNNKSTNAGIRERNSIKRKWSVVLQSMGKRVQRKLAAAQSMRSEVKRLDAGKGTIFNTRVDDATSLAKKRESDALSDFDKLLNQDEGGSFQ